MEKKRESFIPMKESKESRNLERSMKKKAIRTGLGEKKNEHKSSQFFTKMQAIASTDQERKSKKRMAKPDDGRSSKRFKL